MTPRHRPGNGQEMSTLYSRRTRFDDHTPRSVVIAQAMLDWIDYEDDGISDEDDDYEVDGLANFDF